MGRGLLARASRRQRVLGLCVALLAINAVLLLGVPYEPMLPGPALPWPLLAVLFLLGDSVALNVELRRRTFIFHLTEVQLLLGLALVSLPELLLARLVGGVVSMLIERREPLKIFGNAGIHGLEVLVAAGMLHVLSIGPPLAEPVTWPVVPVALMASVIVGHCAVILLSTAATGEQQFDREAWATLLPWSLCVLVEAFLGLLLIDVLDEPAVAAALVMLGVGFGLHHRSVMRQRGRYAQLQLLSHFTEALVGQVETDDVVATVLEQSAEVLRADVAELLLLRTDDGPARWVRHTPAIGAVVQDGPPSASHPALQLAQRVGAGIAIGRGSQDELALAVLAAVGCRNVVVAPLRRGGEVIGALIVADRSDRTLEFSAHDAELAASLAAAASVALDKGQLFDRVKQEASVREHQALHDALTGLPNRALITRHLQAALGHGNVGVLLLDLDRFQDVNDSLGHDVGDRLLLKVAARLRDRLAPRFVGGGGWLARLGGDEFAIVLPGLPDDALAFEAAVVLAVFDEPFPLGDLVLDVRASIGAASRVHADQAGRLLQYAEIAMYDVKRRGGGVNVYLAGDERSSRRRLALAGALRRAVEGGELTVNYQPKVDLATGRPSGVEALVRWTSAEHGIVGPDEFVPIAEQSGLVGALTRFVLDRALERAAAWGSAGRDLTVAVNISPRGLADGSLVEDVPLLLARHGVAADRLILEITEGTIMSDPAASIEVLQRLAALGVGLSIDDFGTGYSSLAYLKRLPVNEVKIDRAFVMGMAGDDDDAAIVRSTVHLAHDLGLKVVAEGVEDAVAYAGLQSLGCDTAQGYLLSRPLPADALEAWLDAWPGHGSALLGAPPQRTCVEVRRPA